VEAALVNPLVETRLYVPEASAQFGRPSATERAPEPWVRRQADAHLGPVVFGKTTLLTAWLSAAATENRSVAWLSLDEGDRQPATFWTYVITALQTAVPGIGAGVLPLLQSAQPPIETVLAAVLNELSAVPNDVDLVLDDYHLVDGGPTSGPAWSSCWSTSRRTSTW
jgi:LuxR family maltose regulon positive regulatory protein